MPHSLQYVNKTCQICLSTEGNYPSNCEGDACSKVPVTSQRAWSLQPARFFSRREQTKVQPMPSWIPHILSTQNDFARTPRHSRDSKIWFFFHWFFPSRGDVWWQQIFDRYRYGQYSNTHLCCDTYTCSPLLMADIVGCMVCVSPLREFNSKSTQYRNVIVDLDNLRYSSLSTQSNIHLILDQLFSNISLLPLTPIFTQRRQNEMYLVGRVCGSTPSICWSK